MQYKCPSSAATPQLLLLEDIDGTGDQVPTLGSNLKKRILDLISPLSMCSSFNYLSQCTRMLLTTTKFQIKPAKWPFWSCFRRVAPSHDGHD